MKKLLSIILTAAISAASAISAFAYDKTNITVHNTEKHGLYITVGGTKIYCDKTELPFIDENDRTQISVRAVSNALGKRVDWNDVDKIVTISDYNDDKNTVIFTIDSKSMLKNNNAVNMDTEPKIFNNHTYVPLKFLGEAFECEVEYTTADRFSDITVSRISDFAGFNQADSITVWGDIEGLFHEAGALGSIMPYEDEAPDLNANYISAYKVTMRENDTNSEYDVYWDTLYHKTFVKTGGVLYTANEAFPRFLDSLLEAGGDAIYVVDDKDRELFAKYGWNINYKLSSLTDTLPQFKELGDFSANEYYYLYNNELSKDIGLDLSKYAEKAVTVDIYQLREGMPEKFYPITTARGIVVKYENEIIGAFISTGRHQVENACSLPGKSFDEITNMSFADFIAPLLKSEDDLKSKTPEEIIKMYCKALNEKDEGTAIQCIAKTTMFGGVTSNLLNTELYDSIPHLPLTNKTFVKDDERRIDNIKSISNVEIKPHDNKNSDEKHKSYTVTFDAEYVQEEAISNGNQYWICTMVYESDSTGWKISSFGH